MPSEIAIAIGVALLVQGGAAVALRMADLDKHADTPLIDKGAATPVRVIPVMDEDLPLLKLGSKKKYKLPDKWNKSPPKPLVEQKAFVSPKADKTEAGIPDKEVKVADAGTEPIPPDADVAKKVDVEVTESSDAGAAQASNDTEGHESGSKEGTETDPLKARAVDQWRSRIAGWFQRGFSCGDLGLEDDELKKLRVGVSVQLSGDGTVTGYSLGGSSGRPEVDAKARARMDAAKGNAIPPKPENYPDIMLTQISITLACK